MFKGCSLSCLLDDVSLGTTRRCAKRCDRVVDAHRLESIVFKDCALSCLGHVSLGASRRYAKEGNRVVIARRLERLVFVNNEANKASNPMTAFPSPGSRIASVISAGDISALWKNRRERGETNMPGSSISLRSLFTYQAPQLLSLYDSKIVADEHISFFVEGDSHGESFTNRVKVRRFVWPCFWFCGGFKRGKIRSHNDLFCIPVRKDSQSMRNQIS